MPITVDSIPDLLQDWYVQEVSGEITEVIRVTVVRVSGTTAWPEIFAAAATAPGVPLPNEPFGNGVYSAVRVRERSARLMAWDGTTATVRVECRYEMQRPPTDNALPISGGANVNQVETQVDANGEPITVSYGGETIVASVPVFEARHTFVRDMVEVTQSPDSLVAYWINAVNSSEFRGFPAREWLMTNITYELVDRASSAYRFRYQAERKPGGWIYVAAYRNEKGDIPGDVAEGNGLTTVYWHKERDFSQKFG